MLQMSGWIKLHRKILEWEWYSEPTTFRVFLHLMLKANHKDRRFKGIELIKGSVVTSRDILSIETGLSVRQVRTALDKLKSTNEVTIKTSSQGTIIQLVNYDKYQLETNETTNERPTSDQQTTTNKNVKKERSIFIPPNFNDILEFCMQNDLDLDANKFINFYESKGWLVGKAKMKNWQAAVRNWATPKQPKEKRYEDMTDGEQIEFNMRKKELEYANKTR
jgi:hypothetical protein